MHGIGYLLSCLKVVCFRRIFPILDDTASADLEDSILIYGCQEPLKLWNGILIDGHNRFGILKKHDVPFKTVSYEFPSRDEVIIWIIFKQIAQRNLTPIQLSFYRGLHYHTDKRIQGSNNQYTKENAYDTDESEKGQSDTRSKTQSTANRLADKYNVSPRTIKRDAVVAKAISAIGDISPDIKMDILSGKTRISKVKLNELANGTEDDISDAVMQIEEGTFVNRRTKVSGGEGSLGGSDIIVMKPWEMQFSKMTDGFRQVLRGYADSDDTTLVKAALREYIGMLEELYRDINRLTISCSLNNF